MKASPGGLVPATRAERSVVQGQRVIALRRPSGVLDTDTVQTLARAEDATVDVWQVTLAPVYRVGIGAFLQGMPGQAFPALATGNPFVRMTYGGGGVVFRVDFPYPKSGSSFAVSGDNVQIDVFFGDNLTVFAPENLPVLSGWVKPFASPTGSAPLFIGFEFNNAIYGPRAILPFCRAIHVSGNTPLATITVNLEAEAGPGADIVLPSAQGVFRIPVAGQNYRVTVTPSVGLVSVCQELAFT